MPQSVFNRYEKKYLMPETVYQELRGRPPPYMQVDSYGLHTICNIYYDTSDDLLITPGKAALIRRVVEAHPGMDYDTLARLSMKELTEYLTESDVDIRDYANYTGTPFESSDRDDDFDPKDAPDDAEEPDDMDLDDADEPDDMDSDDADELEDDD